MELELPTLDGGHQFALQLQLINESVVHLRREVPARALAARFCFVHGDVGIPEQCVDLQRLSRTGSSDADAGSHGDRTIFDRDRSSDALEQPLCDQLRGVVGVVFHQHRELVSPEPSGRVGSARGTREAPCDDPDHLVACLMPQRVVDGLEVVKVEEEDGER